VNRLAGESARNSREQSGEAFALAGLHFDQGSAHHGGPADQLHVMVAKPDLTACGFPRQRECCGEPFDAPGIAYKASAQLCGALQQRAIRKALQSPFGSVHLIDEPRKSALMDATEQRRAHASPRGQQKAFEWIGSVVGPLWIRCWHRWLGRDVGAKSD
jgi:hypothetical protein